MPGSAVADPGLLHANRPRETPLASTEMSDLRKAEFARPKWLFASVERNIAQLYQLPVVPLRRQIGYVSCGIEAHFPGKHEQQFLEQYVSKLGTDSGTPYAVDCIA